MSDAFDKILLRKAQTIERCIKRARDEYAASSGLFLADYTRQDAAILNLQRACEAALDMAHRVVSVKGWGVPDTSKELFAVLMRQQVISQKLTTSLMHMVGFRNLAVHDYEEINMLIVESVINNQTQDLLDFSEQMLKQFFKKESK